MQYFQSFPVRTTWKFGSFKVSGSKGRVPPRAPWNNHPSLILVGRRLSACAFDPSPGRVAFTKQRPGWSFSGNTGWSFSGNTGWSFSGNTGG
jgi:hypothetical protein